MKQFLLICSLICSQISFAQSGQLSREDAARRRDSLREVYAQKREAYRRMREAMSERRDSLREAMDAKREELDERRDSLREAFDRMREAYSEARAEAQDRRDAAADRAAAKNDSSGRGSFFVNGHGFHVKLKGRGASGNDTIVNAGPVYKARRRHDDDRFELQYGMLDLGVNVLHDNTDYNSPAAQQLLRTSDPRTADQFSLRNGKSINVNVYPVLARLRAVSTRGQKLYFTTGAGLQFYNFRFNKPISYLNNTTTEIITDSVHFSKNKLAFAYLTVPLMVTAKTRIAKDGWLVYGVGLSGGYRLSSWTKQVSGERGKQKNFDSFNFNDFNACATAEIGIDNVFRLYASYQLTSLATSGLDQHPICIGVRLFGN